LSTTLQSIGSVTPRSISIGVSSPAPSRKSISIAPASCMASTLGVE